MQQILHNNPFNLKQAPGNTWRDSAGTYTDGHASFLHLPAAIRAVTVQMFRYEQKNLFSLLQKMNVWMPVSDPKADNRPREHAVEIARKMKAQLYFFDSVDLTENTDLHFFDLETGRLEPKEQTTFYYFLHALAQQETFAGYDLSRSTFNTGIGYHHYLINTKQWRP